MKTISMRTMILVALSSAAVATPARADADDAAWIKTRPTEMAAFDRERSWR